jgi:hypothetical protein
MREDRNMGGRRKAIRVAYSDLAKAKNPPCPVCGGHICVSLTEWWCGDCPARGRLDDQYRPIPPSKRLDEAHPQGGQDCPAKE